MLKTARAAFAALILACAAILAHPLTAAAPTAKPEDVGLSSERLKRVAELVQRHVTADDRFHADSTVRPESLAG
jgi:hypothetical protein